MTAIDYSGARFTAAQLKNAGVVAVGRYITGRYAISGSELAGLVQGGITVWFVYEYSANDVAGGKSAGAAHAQQVNAALEALGLPTSQPVYFAADEDLPNPATAVPYFQGIASVRPAATNGDYGEGALCQLLANDGLTGFHWQSDSTSFPGNASTLPITNIQQKVGGSPLPNTDLDVLHKADVGQYPRPAAPPAPVPNPSPKKEFPDMFITAQGNKEWLCSVGAVILNETVFAGTAQHILTATPDMASFASAFPQLTISAEQFALYAQVG